jgi:hypothetical protein
MENKQEYDFCMEWLNELLNSLGENCTSDECANLIQPCGICCIKRIEPIIDQFTGDLTGFMEHMGKEFGHIISWDPERNIILFNENKLECVCTIARCMQGKKVSPTLCYCSANMTGAMFSKITGKTAKTEIKSSVLSGGKTCLFEIKITEG